MYIFKTTAAVYITKFKIAIFKLISTLYTQRNIYLDNNESERLCLCLIPHTFACTFIFTYLSFLPHLMLISAYEQLKNMRICERAPTFTEHTSSLSSGEPETIVAMF